MRTCFGLVLAVLGPLFVGTVSAQEPARARVSLSPLGGYRFGVHWESQDTQEFVVDRRLLRFDVHVEGRRRPHRCAHPQAPRQVDERRVRETQPGWAADEFVDLRMYCTGAALQALDGPARIEASYGFRRRGRRRYIARREGERRPLAKLSAGTYTWSGINPASAEPEGIAPVLRPMTSRGSRPVFRVRVRAPRAVRAYLTDDLYSFRVRQPSGTEVRCAARRQRVTPIVDFFRRVGSRRGPSATLDSALYCPDKTFAEAGVYEVTPVLELLYSGEAFGFETPLGTFEGRTVPVRVLGVYREQPIEETGEPADD